MGWLLNHMGVDAADVVAFGDGENDIEMLQAAGVGCVCPPPPRDTGEGFHQATTSHFGSCTARRMGNRRRRDIFMVERRHHA